MHLKFFLLFLTGSIYGVAQEHPLQVFTSRQRHQDSLKQLAVEKFSRTRKIPLQFADTVGQRNFLLVTDDLQTYSYRASLNQEAAVTTGAAQLIDETRGFRLSGDGMICGIWEDGLVKSHIEFGNRILSKEGSSEYDHATHVTGTILAAGINLQAKGMAPSASAYTFDFGNDLSEMASLTSPDEKSLLFSNHSYGTVTGWSKPNGVWTWFGDEAISTDEDYKHGYYNQRARDIDALAYLSPYYTIVWAAGNDRFETGDGSHPADCNKGVGYDCIIPDAVSKNIITVGAVSKVQNYTSPSSVVMSHYSSWGPTDDGRIKPDLVGVGTDVFSTIAAGIDSYANFTGTSMAAPTVTGSLMLVQELHAKLNAGHYLKAATLKALAIHTAKEAGAKPGPDYQFGWGMLDVKAAADLLVAVNGKENRIIESTLQNSETFQITIEPAPNRKVTATLCWTDPEGSPAPISLDPLDRMLVNDLDIRLIDEDGVITSPWILNPSVPQAQATQGDNIRDNVEKIEFETPLAKTYTVVVKHKGELKYEKQDFSLVLTYIESTVPSKVFYWIGNTGQWNDPAHWSFTSGGTSAGEIPGENDAVIVDHQSLLENDTLLLTESTAVSRITWINTQPTVLNLSGNTLRINSQLTISDEAMRIVGGGVLQFAAAEAGVINLSSNSHVDSDMIFDGGTWVINGSFQANTIRIVEGTHTWSCDRVQLQTLVLESPAAWNISGVELSLSTSLQMPSTAFSFNAPQSVIKIKNGAAEIDWRNQNYEGSLEIDANASLRLLGDALLSSLTLKGNLETAGSFTWDSVKILDHAVWRLNDNMVQTIQRSFILQSSGGSAVEISAPVKATLLLEQHEKLCFDNVIVQNVDVLGNAVVNLGENSTVTNAANWLQLLCEDVLFADFTFDFPCTGGLTYFTDASTGDPTSWQWTFETNELTTTSGEQNAAQFFSKEGSIIATLSIQKNNQSASHTKEVTIQANTLEHNQIVLVGSGELMSLATGSSYQWFNNRIAIENEVTRTFDYQQQPGLYEILITQDACNRFSEPYLVTDLEELKDELIMYPNPSNGYLIIKAESSQFYQVARLMDAKGNVMAEINLSEPVITKTWADGFYLIEVRKKTGQVVSRKLIISH